MKWCKVIVCAYFVVFILVTGDVILGSSPRHATACQMQAAVSDTLINSQEKEKIKKTEEDPLDKIIKKKEKKGGPDRKAEESRYEQVSEEKSSFWGSCLGDLMGSICSGMLSSALGGDEEDPATDVELEEPITFEEVTTQAPSELGTIAGDMDTPETLPYIATVMPASASETTVLLWDRPGGETKQTVVIDTLTQPTVIDTLAMGAEVSVIKISQIENVFWVKVVTMQEPRIIGWIREEEASPIEEPDTR